MCHTLAFIKYSLTCPKPVFGTLHHCQSHTTACLYTVTNYCKLPFAYRAQSGNPAVPVAQQLTGAEQCQAPPDDSTEQSLSFGRPSEGKESSSPVLPGSTAVMQPAIAQTPGSSTQPSTSMPGTSGAEASNAAAASSLIPASTQAMGQGEIRHGQRQGQGSALSDQASASSLPAVATSFAGQDSGQNDSRLAQAHIPPALQFGPSTSATALEAAVTESGAKSAAVGSGSSQQARQHQSAAAASDRQDSLRGYEIHRSLPPSTDAGLQHPQGSASHLAEQGVVLGSDSGESELMSKCVVGLSLSVCMSWCRRAAATNTIAETLAACIQAG